MQIFENTVFLFFSHPFDIGDEIYFEGTRYEVASITLQYVKLLRWDGAAVNVPCGELRTARIHNITRSQNLWGEIRVVVDMDTPTSALEIVGAQVSCSISMARLPLKPRWRSVTHQHLGKKMLPINTHRHLAKSFHPISFESLGRFHDSTMVYIHKVAHGAFPGAQAARVLGQCIASPTSSATWLW
jgi:hypothetical protein